MCSIYTPENLLAFDFSLYSKVLDRNSLRSVATLPDNSGQAVPPSQ